MIDFIAIVLLLKAVSNAAKFVQKDDISGRIVEAIALLLHLYLGMWLITNVV